MIRDLFFTSTILILLGSAAANATDGFVIEANNARPDVGIQVRADTRISIGEGGHIVLMTEVGQMIRKDGPFTGSAGSILAGKAEAGLAMESGLLASLLELAELSGKSEEQLGAVRGTNEEGAERPDAISSAVSDFCLAQGEIPEFYASKAPALDEPLIVRRRVQPIQFLQTIWPAGENSLTWPDDWPPPEDGQYVWALGDRGPVALRIIALEETPDNSLAAAALQYELGCELQAKGAFRAALAEAERD